jgi:hypothetical protein
VVVDTGRTAAPMPTMTDREFGATLGGGGRAPVTHVMVVSDTVTTAQGTEFTATDTASMEEPNPWPTIVRVVPPRELPTLGAREATEGVSAVSYTKG